MPDTRYRKNLGYKKLNNIYTRQLLWIISSGDLGSKTILKFYEYINFHSLTVFSFNEGLMKMTRTRADELLEELKIELSQKQPSKSLLKCNRELLITLNTYKQKINDQKQTILLVLNRYLVPDISRKIAQDYI